MDNSQNVINVLTKNALTGEYEIYSTSDELIQAGENSASIPFDSETGTYFVWIKSEEKSHAYESHKN